MRLGWTGWEGIRLGEASAERMFSRLGREEVVGVAIKGMRRPLVDVSLGLAIVDMM